ncbi:MAG: hypothetical protein K2O85_07055 [Helicobacter sp.]|nr:hypothetical protein [Helicobacter sp.]
MTKGIMQFFMGAALFAGIATADTDLFAKLSNGAMSDKGEGITELSKEQKAKVVGGLYVIETSFFNYREGGVVYPYSYQTGIIFRTDNSDSRLLGYAMDVNREDLVMLTRYNYNPGSYNFQFVIVDRASGRMKRTTWGSGPAYILKNYEAQAKSHNASIRFPYR